jgi:putative ABC transport system permease protein
METLGLRYALRQRTRFALTAGGVACALVLSVFVIGVYRGASRGSLSYLEQTGADVWVGGHGAWNLMRSSGFMPPETLAVVAGTDGVGATEGILTALAPARIQGEPRTLLVIGIDSLSAMAVPRNLAAGRATPGPGEVVIDEAFARRAHLSVGQTLDLSGHALRIVGISRRTNLLVTQYAFANVMDVEDALGFWEHRSFLLVKAAPGIAPATLARRIEARAPGVVAYPAAAFLDNNRREIARGFLPVLWAIALLAIAVGATVVSLMTYTAVLEKRADYALLAALGGGVATRVAVVLGQALTAAFGGGIGGVAILVALEKILPGVLPEVGFQLEPNVAVVALAGALLMALVGSMVPAYLACRVPPMEAFRR